MRVMCYGATRSVLLVGRWAVKVPRAYSWRTFLTGLLANMQEREFSRLDWPVLCPVVFALPGGWLLAMRRADPLPDALWDTDTLRQWLKKLAYNVPVEMKRDSFGVLDGNLVVVDYGS